MEVTIFDKTPRTKNIKKRKYERTINAFIILHILKYFTI